ncbi:MAG: sulfite exporter TauE/SafE family protein [Planctomycetes bacterium]|nr:sulfite exporter TauE/SafE family protein [Planctomycetota bacterium]
MADLLIPALLLASLLYASVGHAGASGYLVALTLAGVAMPDLRPCALIMNTVVATIALVQFASVGCFRWRLFWPFAVTSIPMAVLGGALPVSGSVHRVLLGIALGAAAVRLMLEVSAAPRHDLEGQRGESPEPSLPALSIALPAGAIIGLLAGLTGTGGGIFLSPLLILMRWGRVRDSAGVAAAFILLNSIGGLVGIRPRLEALPADLWIWCVVVVVGGTIGSWFGSRRAPPRALKLALSAVLLVAAGKLALT